MYDCSITGAEVIDGAGTGPRRADVAVEGGYIAAVGEPGLVNAAETVDATGLYLCPGFIDMHSHSDLSLLADPRAESKVRQGVTLDIAGNCGSSAAPIAGPSLAAVTRRMRRWNQEPDWRSMGDYMSRLDRQGMGLNYACFTGHGTLRATVMGYEMRAPAQAELETMKRLLRESMEAGALGLSTGLIYPPSSYADTGELVELCAIVREYDGIYSTHIRNEGSGLLPALREALEIGGASGVRVQVSHLKCSARSHWGIAREALALIEAARAQGLDVQADQYPYTASSTGLGVFVPQWAQNGGREALLGRLRDPEMRDRIAHEMTAWRVARDPEDPDTGWESVVIAHTPRTPEWEGQTVRDIARSEGKSGSDTALDLLLANGGDAQVVIWSMSEADVRQIMSAPWVMVGSDSETRATDGPLHSGKPHPRGYGTFPRVLAHYARDEGVLNWGVAVHKMTGLSAARLGLQNRGRIAEGMVADLVLLDPQTLEERATFEQPHAYPSGVPHVMVGGRWVIRDGRPTGELPGRVVRNPRGSGGDKS